MFVDDSEGGGTESAPCRSGGKFDDEGGMDDGKKKEDDDGEEESKEGVLGLGGGRKPAPGSMREISLLKSLEELA